MASLGDGTPFDYCYGDNEDTTFVFVNPSAGEIVLELFNLPTSNWLASSTDHVEVYDGPDQGAPLLYTSIGNNAVIDGTTVVSTNDTVALTSNTSASRPWRRLRGLSAGPLSGAERPVRRYRWRRRLRRPGSPGMHVPLRN